MRLREAGIEPVIGHDATNLPDNAEVVISTAISEDNPELATARAAGATVLHRGDLLGELSRMKRTIAVGGTHGKTTSASMAALALLESGRQPAYLIGGELRAAGTNAAWGAGEWAVIEADESDRSFLKLGRDVAVVTNVELDHHATYANLGELEEAFREWVEPAAVRVLGPGVELPGDGDVVTFGIGDAEHLTLTAGGSRFAVDGVEVNLQVPGEHNVLNALAALAAVGARACPFRKPRPASRSSRAPAAGSRRTAALPVARSCTTTTPITPPRCAPRSRPRGRSSRTAWSPRSSRISTRARRCSPATSAARSRWLIS